MAALIPGQAGAARFTKALGLVFDWQDTASRAELETFLFGSDLQWHMHELTETIRTPTQYLGNCSPAGSVDGDDAMHHWTSSTLSGDPDHPVLLSSSIGDGKTRVLVSRTPLPLHYVLTIDEHARRGTQSIRVRPMRVAATLMTPTGSLHVTEVETC